MITLNVNGKPRNLDVPDDMPLLWTLRDVLSMTGTKFGCGMGLCGACTIQIDGQPTRSCITPVSAAVGKQITTIEAIGATPAGKKIQRAWLALDVPQCGYCQSGQIMSASALLASKPEAERRGHRRCDGGQHLPLRHLSAYSRCNQAGRGRRTMPSPARRFEMKTASIEIRDAVSSSRRNFLKLTATAAIGGGLMLGFGLPARGEIRDTLTTDAPFAPNAFLRIDRAGKVTFVMPVIEMGQGTYTSLPMLIAEELEVDVDKVAIEHSPPDDKIYVNPLIGVQMTGGSTAIRGTYLPLRQRRRDGSRHARDCSRSALERRPVHLSRAKRVWSCTDPPAASLATASWSMPPRSCRCPRRSRSRSRPISS